MAHELTRESWLPVSAETAWELVRRMSTVNRELSPWARMTFPGGDYLFSELETELDVVLFTSWILVLGLVPLDWHHVRMNKVVDGRGFSENSVSVLHRYWRHERWIEPAGGGCVIRDRVVFQPQLPLIGHLALPVYRMVFGNRHRRLARLLGPGSIIRG